MQPFNVSTLLHRAMVKYSKLDECLDKKKNKKYRKAPRYYFHVLHLRFMNSLDQYLKANGKMEGSRKRRWAESMEDSVKIKKEKKEEELTVKRAKFE
ncbi:hypothetical protein GCK72_007241 [Caenorhabditis remanei]|uniref:Uncharacterized protein n=1 Tax=Caenorhabditis remanei TaxID=31234 RepID=A0A6A5HNC7_CAERE|nr:hypothetical protein GCK72_007241 [Caenorhabditis remanei]KAF1767282.1 hypothetical protein GCK72_007241 [Caenorhabditis remanei]